MAEERDGFEAVADEGDVREGELLGVEVNGEAVVLARLDGQLHAIGGLCTHMHGPLAEGTLDGDVLECPVHRGHFNIRTGEAVKPPPREPEPVYDVKIEDGRIWVSRKPRG
jgi:nitrite reductase/ring-hydroxylating ferredoxin subunit